VARAVKYAPRSRNAALDPLETLPEARASKRGAMHGKSAPSVPPGRKDVAMILQFAAKPEDHPGRKKNKDRAHEDPPLDEDASEEAKKPENEIKPVWSRDIRPKRCMARAEEVSAAE
jgi:hypothetical protein